MQIVSLVNMQIENVMFTRRSEAKQSFVLCAVLLIFVLQFISSEREGGGKGELLSQ